MELLLRILLSCLVIGKLSNADSLEKLYTLNGCTNYLDEPFNETAEAEKPPAPSIDIINSTCIKVRLNVEKYKKILPISVVYYILSHEVPFSCIFPSITAYENTTGVEGFIKDLSPGVHYSVASIVYINFKGYVSKYVNVTMPCTESVASNFIILSNKTSITINNEGYKKVNDPCHYFRYLIRMYKEAEMLFNGSTAFPKVFNNLEPFTRYKIVISSEKSLIVDKLVYTLPIESLAVRSVDLIEVDTKKSTMTFAWNPPEPPHHGKLEFYTIQYCESNSINCHNNETLKVNSTELCKLWDVRDDMLCKTILLPQNTTKYDVIRIRAFNEGVPNGSEPIDVPITRNELLPSSPRNLNVSSPLVAKTIIANLTWNHPYQSGGLLEEFQITVKLINSSLKVEPWKIKTIELKIGPNGYQRKYSTEIELFPASTFQISVNALTWSKLSSDKAEKTSTQDTFAYFDKTDLKPQLDKNIISIKIPKIVNDIQGSRLIVGVQGPGHCDKHYSQTAEDNNLYLNIINSTNEFAWTAGSITVLELKNGTEFRVGDRKFNENAKNYVLCPNTTYVIYMMLVDDGRKKVLEVFKTNPIYIGEQPRSNAMWATLTSPIFVTLALIIFKACRRKSNITVGLLPNKSTTKSTEEVPLNNDPYRKSHLSEIESSAKYDEGYELPYSNLLIIEQNKTYLMPVRIEDIENYFEKFFSNGALYDEYVRCKNEEDYAVTVTESLLPNTVNDFWQMIWQEEVQIVYAMSHLVKNKQGKRKKYWPSVIGQKLLYGTMSVQFLSEKVHTDFTYRIYHVFSADHEVRTVSSILINDSAKYSSFNF